jgi:anti-sigma regulatory factor (Ser/Thr protein kinase)
LADHHHDLRVTSFSTMNLFATQPSTLGAIRRWAKDELTDLPRVIVGDILLVVTELVTNAYEHGGGPRRVRLTRHDAPLRVTVEVEDVSARTPTVGKSRFGPDHHRGRGLVLVARLAAEWGVTPQLEGKTVWARFS